MQDSNVSSCHQKETGVQAMDKQEISNSIEAPMAKTVEFKVPAEAQSAQPSSSEADRCKNGVCRVTWKPQRPAAA
ncbi:MAG TPA: hypothetical protein V6C69_14595 [Trichormus sp.]|jgi:hypothetical protein